MVALCRGIALSLRFLSLGYRFTKTPPRGVFACSHPERSQTFAPAQKRRACEAGSRRTLCPATFWLCDTLYKTPRHRRALRSAQSSTALRVTMCAQGDTFCHIERNEVRNIDSEFISRDIERNEVKSKYPIIRKHYLNLSNLD